MTGADRRRPICAGSAHLARATPMTYRHLSVIGNERPSSETLGRSVASGPHSRAIGRLRRRSFERSSSPHASTERFPASMRQPTRPFITAYKGRTSKSRTSNPWKIEETENAGGSQSLNEPSASASLEIERDPSYLAALDAADAVFGGKAAELPQVPPPSTGRQGRVLPNLLQEQAINAPPASAESTRTRRVRRPAKVAKAVPAEPKKKKPQPAAVAPTPPVQRPKEREPAIVADRSSRAIRPIQNKWVWKTELKAGENWKRRFSKFAR